MILRNTELARMRRTKLNMTCWRVITVECCQVLKAYNMGECLLKYKKIPCTWEISLWVSLQAQQHKKKTSAAASTAAVISAVVLWGTCEITMPVAWSGIIHEETS